MTPGQTVETLTEAAKAKEVFDSASEIRVHPSGKFVYSGNRGHDTFYLSFDWSMMETRRGRCL